MSSIQELKKAISIFMYKNNGEFQYEDLQDFLYNKMEIDDWEGRDDWVEEEERKEDSNSIIGKNNCNDCGGLINYTGDTFYKCRRKKEEEEEETATDWSDDEEICCKNCGEWGEDCVGEDCETLEEDKIEGEKILVEKQEEEEDKIEGEKILVVPQ